MRRERDEDGLAFHLLGGARILCGESLLTGSLARKEQALLIYLVCQPEQRFSRERLATLLWGEVPQSRARYNLRRALWNLRRALDQAGFSPDDCLAIDGTWICVPSAASCWADVREFEDVLQACFQSPRSRPSSASEGIRRIHKALDLYQGDFLAGFSIPNAPSFEEWLVFERERLFLLLLRALTSLIQDFLARGERDEAIASCQRLLVLDPLQEDIHRLLMRLYWETGQRAQALRQYNTYQDLLQRELGIKPLEETQDLYQRILKHEAAPISASSLVLTSRLTPPSPAPESLIRSRLFPLLDQGLTLRLTLLSAPPGYGKTTLMAQWLAACSQNEVSERPRETDLSFVWYKVDETDNAPSIFVEGLAASVARVHSHEGLELQDQVHDVLAVQRDPRQAVALLLRALALRVPTRFVIVLDDLERLTGLDSQKVLGYLVEHLPENAHLYLLTRVDPDLPLPRLRVRGQLLELRASDLRFADEEVTAFLEQAHSLNLGPAEIAELATRAEGWIAPLWLAVNALSRFTTSLDDVWEGLFAYIRDEVLTPQPPEVRAFLLRSAILDILTPTLCQTVLGVPGDLSGVVGGSAKWLAELERRNLFLRRIGPHATTPAREAREYGEPRYAYQSLFLTFLRAELGYYLSHTEIEEHHRRAAEAWEQQGDLETALHHLQQVGDESEVARLLERMAPAYLQQGRLEPLARWLNQLEPAVRDQHPQLTLNAGRLCQAEGRLEEAQRLYLRAVDGFTSQQDNGSCGDSLLALAELELLRGRYTEGIEWIDQAMGYWSDTDIQRRATGLCIVGQSQACQGNLPGAESTLKQAQQMGVGCHNPLLAFQVFRTRAWVAYLQGSFHQAVGLSRLAEQEAGCDVRREVIAAFRNPMPAILREWGESESAWRATHRRCEAAEQIQDWLALSHAYVDLGNLHLDRDQFEEAEDAFRQAIATARVIGEDGFCRMYGEAHLVYAYWLQGRWKEAFEEAEAVLTRSQARSAPPLELAVAQLVTSLAGIRFSPSDGFQEGRVAKGLSFPESSFQLLREVHQAFDQMDVRYGAFVSAVLLGLACLTKDAEDLGDQRRQARRYAGQAMTLAGAEGYYQTLVTAHRLVLPLMFFSLREGIEVRFIGQVLARIGHQSLPGILEMAQDPTPEVRARATAALELIGAQTETRQESLAALKRLILDLDPEVRDLADQALRQIERR